MPHERAAEGLRFGLGRDNDEDQIDRVAALLPALVARVAGGEVAAVTSAGRERIVVALSGGVDSSTAAALLVDAGYDVVGATLRLYDAQRDCGQHRRALLRPARHRGRARHRAAWASRTT